MRNSWKLWSQEVEKVFCDDMVKNFSKIDPVEGTTFNGNSDWRKSIIRWVHGEHGLKNHFLQYILDANSSFFGLDAYSLISEMQFTEYPEGSGFYKDHHDVDWLSSSATDRKLTMVIQLSDPETYKGGDLLFSECENPEPEQLRKQGSVIVFPSYFRHRVTEVTEGTRYSLVSWVNGPRWR